MKKLTFILVAFFVSSQARAESDYLPKQIENTCSLSVEEDEGTYGKEYFVTPTQMDSFGGRHITATTALVDGKTQIKLSLHENGGSKIFTIPLFDFKRVLLTETSAWFLSDDRIREFSFSEKRITGEYSSFPRDFEMHLTTRARGFAYSSGYIYIAHGELGVSVFDAKNHQHYTVIKAGLQPASLAAAVQVRGNDLYLLQGAYHPQGFNGVAIVNLTYGSAKLISYPQASGVVDPYSSSMRIVDEYLVINNSGWIHGYLISNLKSGPAVQAPAWLQVFEAIDTAGGNFDKYLMIEGDFTVSDGELLACSSISYVPVGQRRPIKEWRMIRKKL